MKHFSSLCSDVACGVESETTHPKTVRYHDESKDHYATKSDRFRDEKPEGIATFFALALGQDCNVFVMGSQNHADAGEGLGF